MAEIFEHQLTIAVGQIGNPATAPARAALIASQMLGLAMTRYVLAFKPALDLERDAVVDSVGAAVQLYLDQ